MVTIELRRFAGCEAAWYVVIVGLDAEISGATWTVSRFNSGESNAYACDRALQVIVPHYQRLYDLKRNTRGNYVAAAASAPKPVVVSL